MARLVSTAKSRSQPSSWRGRGAQLQRPVGPGQGLVLALRRLRHDLELGDRGRALAVGGADAVRAGVAAADHHHVLALGGDRPGRRGAGLVVAGDALVLLRSGNPWRNGCRRARGPGTSRSRGCSAPPAMHQRVVVVQQPLHRDRRRRPRRRCGRSTPSASICSDAPVDQVLLHLEVGDAVAQQAADAVVLLEHRHRMAGAGQLLGAGQARRAGADHRDALAGAARRGLRRDPALLPAAVDDRRIRWS